MPPEMPNVPPRLGGRRTLPVRLTVAFFGLLLAFVAGAPSAAASAPGGVEVGYGAAWLSSQVDPIGGVSPGQQLDSLKTLQTALALAASGHEGATLTRQLTFMSSNGSTLMLNPALHAQTMGLMLQVSALAGLDATDLGGFDAVAALQASLASGTYAQVASDPQGIEAQAAAILGLVALGITPDASAVAWLSDQQCDASDGSLSGAFMQRARSGVEACVSTAGDPSGVSVRATASASAALLAAGSAPTVDPTAFLLANQRPDGGFSDALLGRDTEATAAVVQYLALAGVDVTASPWAVAGGSPVSALRNAVAPCTDPLAAGGFVAFTGSTSADVASTSAAVLALSGGPVTLLGAATPGFVSAPLVCPPPVTTTTTTAPGPVATTLPTAVSGKTLARSQVGGEQLARSGASPVIALAGVALLLAGFALRRTSQRR